MATALPHSSVITLQLNEFLDDMCEEMEVAAHDLRSCSEFRGIYKNSHAAHAVLRRLGHGQIGLLRAAQGVCVRLPLLIACRQVTLSYVELRRLIELIVWFPYFREHAVEWREFSSNPGRGFVRDMEEPIAYCAHREFRWYLAYIRERFSELESKLVQESADALNVEYANSSAFVHGGMSGAHGVQTLEMLDTDTMARFRTAQRRVLSGACILIVAARPDALAKLNAVERAWFDWLIGATHARSVRGCGFGE